MSPLQEVNMIAKLADLQETNFQNTIVIHAMIELLIEKGLFKREELLEKAHQINLGMNQQLANMAQASHLPS